MAKQFRQLRRAGRHCFIVGIILSVCSLITPGWAGTPNPALVVTPPQPAWNGLTPQQQAILTPLRGDWEAMEAYRRKKWIGIAQRFSTMTPDEQRRVQSQMQEWAKLTPEQRQRARAKYQTVNQLPLEQKQMLKQKWERYVNLPEEEKQKHKQEAAKPQAVFNKPVPKPVSSMATTLLPPASPTLIIPAPIVQSAPIFVTPAPAVTPNVAEVGSPPLTSSGSVQNIVDTPSRP